MTSSISSSFDSLLPDSMLNRPPDRDLKYGEVPDALGGVAKDRRGKMFNSRRKGSPSCLLAYDDKSSQVLGNRMVLVSNATERKVSKRRNGNDEGKKRR